MGSGSSAFGWWIAGVAIDPFDADHVAYATGATVYASRDLTQADRRRGTTWTPWVDGIEQTAVIALCSPPAGPRLLSGFGDISGFAHEDLSVSPQRQFVRPVFNNTNGIDYAGLKPLVVVRSGTPHNGEQSQGADGSTLAMSEDGGLTWSPLGRPRAPGNATPDNNQGPTLTATPRSPFPPTPRPL